MRHTLCDSSCRRFHGRVVRDDEQVVANHLNRVKNSIESKRVAMVPGNGRTRHSFICVDDVASFLCSAACGGPTGIFEAGGPQALSFLDVVRLYEQILGIKLRVKTTPAWVFRAIATVAGPFSPAASNIMRLNYVSATEDSVIENAVETATRFGVCLTSAESFLNARVAASRATAAG